MRYRADGASSTEVIRGQEDAATSGVRPFDVVSSCAALFALAVAQPLLDLLGRNAEFFLARDAVPQDIILLALGLGVLLPLLISVMVLAVYRVREVWGRIAHVVVITLLGGLLALELVDHLSFDSLPVGMQVGLAVLIGIALAAGFFRWESIRSLFRFASTAVLVVPIVFLFLTSTSRLIHEGDAALVAGAAINDPAPIVILVFDELPVASIMDAEGDIQTDVYPGFARLAEDATWFRNAITVQRLSQFSVPAILSGINPSQDMIPTVADYPNNIFTLLHDSYDIDALESITALCPDQTCHADPSKVSTRRRWGTLIQDLRIVASHVLLPEGLTNGLPPIDQTWADFEPVAAEMDDDQDSEFSRDAIQRNFRMEVDEGRGATTEAFLQGIDAPADRPTLDFAHVLLPHTPWEYVASGQRYTPPVGRPGAQRSAWGSDAWLVNQAYQAHLVQVQYVDSLVAQMISRLEEIGIYDETLVVVTADHGVVFRPNVKNRRAATEASVGDIAAVPLFIKLPGQVTGEIDDYRAETPDVLPTIAEALGTRLPWESDGVRLFNPDRPMREQSVITGGGTVVFGTGGREKFEVAAEKIKAFGNKGPWGLAPEGTADLLGKRLERVEVQESSSMTAALASPEEFFQVDTNGEYLPLLVEASIEGDVPDKDVPIAVSVNGVIVAVTRTYQTEEGTFFYSLLPPSSMRDGENLIEFAMVDWVGSRQQLVLIARKNA